MTEQGIVESLACYPVKGCAGAAVDRSSVTETGLLHDRSFMLVGAADSVFLSQRRLPRMAVIQPTVCDGGAQLTLSAPGADEAELEVAFDGPRRAVSLFGKWFGEGVDQGDAIAKWCSGVLKTHCRLVRVPPDHDRSGWGEAPGSVGFADAHALLVTSLSSLDELNARILRNGAEPIPMDRFRPNIVVAGWPEPHTEDRVRRMSIGSAEFGYSVRAIRCAVPTVDQRIGERKCPEPTRTLASYRREPELGGVSFGVKVAVLRVGEVSVGAAVTVSRWEG